MSETDNGIQVWSVSRPDGKRSTLPPYVTVTRRPDANDSVEFDLSKYKGYDIAGLTEPLLRNIEITKNAELFFSGKIVSRTYNHEDNWLTVEVTNNE